ncbi:MAG: DMT family transporter [Lentisphaeria bacterium]|nr:DMT family transporter [Lentisphaeria bacterium]
MSDIGWFPLILLSACALGFYDFSKKHAVAGNRVMPVLFLATLCGTLFMMATTACTGHFSEYLFCSWQEWGWIMGKSIIVTASWIAGYFALHDLPISLAAPIRASAPVWTTIGGFVFFHECPRPLQFLGMLVVFAGYYIFSTIGKREGFSFKSRGIRMIIAATLIGAASALYDRYILHVVNLEPNVVQFHFSIDLVALLGLAWIFQKRIPFMHEDAPFRWKWTIPAIGILLIAADFFFFHALHTEGTQVGILSVLRRTSVIVSFACGAWYFGEKDIPKKVCALTLVVIGIIILGFAK